MCSDGAVVWFGWLVDREVYREILYIEREGGFLVERHGKGRLSYDGSMHGTDYQK